jgi:hypothetical protein
MKEPDSSRGWALVFSSILPSHTMHLLAILDTLSPGLSTILWTHLKRPLLVECRHVDPKRTQFGVIKMLPNP